MIEIFLKILSNGSHNLTGTNLQNDIAKKGYYHYIIIEIFLES
jgi:hypothetical protein